MHEISGEVDRSGGGPRAVVGRLSRRLRQAQTADEITLSQASVLKQMEQDGPATIVMLAAAEWVRPQSLGATLSALERRGLVARSPDPDDGRCTVFTPTPAGKMALDGVRRNRDELLARLARLL